METESNGERRGFFYKGVPRFCSPLPSVSLLFFPLLFLFAAAMPARATCGGGGGGGDGGISPNDDFWKVPWQTLKPTDNPPATGLVLYWFPNSDLELEKSSLRFSRTLQLLASRCVSLSIAPSGSAPAAKFAAQASLPIVVLAKPDGTLVTKIESQDHFLKVTDVEKAISGELDRSEGELSKQLDAAEQKNKAGDAAAAISLYRAVYDQKCLYPGPAKKARKSLQKLGVKDLTAVFDAPRLDTKTETKIERELRLGLKAENEFQFSQAERHYRAARDADPADPTALRYLGELYRHHIGDWDKARATFDRILARPADPISRAVALHGLGKMTIHEGHFKEGLHLMEQSVQEYPLAIAYRNLAVYWNSEGDSVRAASYTRQALALAPNDPYNRVFAAVFLAAAGKKAEALKIARDNEGLLPASYNLAAIYAQNGMKKKALALLRRHFFEYERNRSVRSKEMMEARVDFVFDSLRKDPDFLALTSGADGRLPMPGGAVR